MEAARPKVNSDPEGKSMLLQRQSLFCTHLDSSIPCSAHPDPLHSSPHTLTAPGAVTTLSTTRTAAAQAATRVSLVPPCPVYLCSRVSIQTGYPQLCQPRTVSPRAPSGPSALFGRTALAHSRKAQRALTGTSPTMAGQSSWDGKLQREHAICLRGEHGRERIFFFFFFWWGSSFREKTNLSKPTAQLQNL